MIRIKTGDIFEEDAEALVNTVNCVGVMGRGVALQFKRQFPDNFNAYAVKCERNEIKLGQVFVFETGRIDGPRYIINFPTKRHWRSKSRLADIHTGLKSLAKVIRERGIGSLAIPALGSGLGGLDWQCGPREHAGRIRRPRHRQHRVLHTRQWSCASRTGPIRRNALHDRWKGCAR